MTGPASAQTAGTAKKSVACWKALGTREFFGSAEQVQQLKAQIRAANSITCPRVGFSYRATGRAGLVAFDRAGGVILRMTRFPDQEATLETWTPASDRSVLSDDPDDGFDQGTYTFNASRNQVSQVLRAFVRRNAGNLGASL